MTPTHTGTLYKKGRIIRENLLFYKLWRVFEDILPAFPSEKSFIVRKT